MSKLFEIGQDLEALQALLEETGGEIRPEHEAALNEFMAEVAGNQAEKLDRYVGLIRSLEGEAATATATADQFAKKAKTRTASAAWLKANIKNYLEGTKQKKVNTVTGFTIAVQTNGGKLPMDLDELKPIPSEFTKIIPAREEPDKDKIRAALEAGQCLDFARLGERGTHLKIS